MRTLGLAPEGEPDMQAWMDFLTRLYDAEEEVLRGFCFQLLGGVQIWHVCEMYAAGVVA